MSDNGAQKSLHHGLTADLRKYARQRSRLSISSMPLFLLLVLVSGMFAVTVDLLILAGLIFDFSEPKPLGFVIFATASNVAAVACLVPLAVKRLGLYRDYCFVLMNGAVTDAEIKGIDQEWNVQLNDTPRTIVDMVVQGKPIRIKTFAPEILDYCSTGSSMALIWHADLPGIIIPVDSLKPKPRAPEPETFVA